MKSAQLLGSRALFCTSIISLPLLNRTMGAGPWGQIPWLTFHETFCETIFFGWYLSPLQPLQPYHRIKSIKPLPIQLLNRFNKRLCRMRCIIQNAEIFSPLLFWCFFIGVAYHPSAIKIAGEIGFLNRI